MISFYPGPSRVYDEIPNYVKEAHALGVLAMNHRSQEFEALCKATVGLLKAKLDIPKNFTVFFTSSATECWEVIAQSVIERESIHILNGAFGEKWYDYTRRLQPGAKYLLFDREAALRPDELTITTGEVICVTQNETSNGTQVSNTDIRALQKNNPRHLIAVDATSSMAGIRLNFKSADIWFASVQKCFGLPAGLAIMVVSPKAMERIGQIGENRHYNSITFMTEMIGKWQTPCTPNVLAIYLLLRTLENRKPIHDIHTKTKDRYEAWQNFFRNSNNLELLIRNPRVRSLTVIAVKTAPEQIEKIKTQARKKGFLLGEGYGPLKKNTFRIANFPALKDREIKGLMRFLAGYRQG